MNKNYLYEVIPIKVILIIFLVLCHSFAIYSGDWPKIPFSLFTSLGIAFIHSCFIVIDHFISSKKNQFSKKNL